MPPYGNLYFNLVTIYANVYHIICEGINFMVGQIKTHTLSFVHSIFISIVFHLFLR